MKIELRAAFFVVAACLLCIACATVDAEPTTFSEDPAWVTIGFQILTGITIGVSSGLIFAGAAYARSTWRHRETVSAFRMRIEDAKVETSIEKAQAILDSQPEDLSRSRPEVTASSWQYRLFEHELEALRVKLVHEGAELRPAERGALEQWLVSTNRVLQMFISGNALPPPEIYDGFWTSLEEQGWSGLKQSS